MAFPEQKKDTKPSGATVRAFTQMEKSLLVEFLGGRSCYLLIAGIFVGVVGVLIELALGFGLQFAFGTDEATGTLATWVRDRGWGAKEVLLGLCVLGVMRSVMLWFSTYIPTKLQAAFQTSQRKRMVHSAFFNRANSVGAMTALFNESTAQASQIMRLVLETSVYVVMGLCYSVALFFLSRELFFVTGITLLFMLVPVKLANRVCIRAGVGLFNDWQKVSSRLLMGMRNLPFLRVTGMAAAEANEALRGLDSHYAHNISYLRANALELVNPQFVGIFLVWILAGFANSHEIPKTVFLTYFYILVRLLQGLANASSRASNVSYLWPHFSHVYDWFLSYKSEFHESMPEVSRKSEALTPATGPLGWELKDVTFAYPLAGQVPILENISLRIPPGKTTVIIGPSGAGKSTLLNLLIGDLSPTSGEISVLRNGRRLPLGEVQTRILGEIGYVNADPFFIGGTVRENLLYGLRRTPTDAEIAEALEISECQFVWRMDEKIEHRLSDQGEGISTGQKQRLSLARAILRSPKALVLDETTANLDQETERRLVDTLGKLSNRFTIVAVTHRRELLRIAGQVIDLGLLGRHEKKLAEKRKARPKRVSGR